MERQLSEAIRRKIIDSLAAPVPAHTRRDIRLPGVSGKAFAVIGMRRSGKTTFLWQCLQDRLLAGAPRESLLYFSFDDDRLAGMRATDLDDVLETYYRLHPHLRDRVRATFFFDEIQSVAGWELFARRLMDTEKVDLFLSGSSAKLLSREVATSMRGRALEVLVQPFGLRECLRHAGREPERPWRRMTKAERSAVEHGLRAYLARGGFPEAQGVAERDQERLLRSYVDVALLRDVIERHAVSNPTALLALLRHLLGNPGGLFSVQKFYDTLRSMGVAVGKDTVHAYLSHLEDAFLVRTVSLHTASERQRMVNPRKAYPVDPGLIFAYERSGRANLGHALETAVLLELDRRGAEVGYLKTPSGWEVDFHARIPGGGTWLMQVCADTAGVETLEREIRALEEASTLHPNATPCLITLDSSPPRGLPKAVRWTSAAEWLLDGGSEKV